MKHQAGILLAVIICLISISTKSLATETILPQASLWYALEPFGNEKLAQSEKVQQAFYEFGEFFHSMDAWRASIYLPHQKQPNWFAFREDIQEYSLKEFSPLDRSYKHTFADSISSSIFFHGLWSNTSQNESPYFDFSIHELNLDKSDAQTVRKKFGTVSGQLNLSQGSLKEENTRIDLNVNVSLESMMFTEMLESIETVNMLFEQKYLNRENADIRIKHATQKTAHTIDHLSSFEKQVFANLYTALPHIMTTLTSFSTFEKLAEPVTSPSGQQATMITHQQKLNLKKFAQHFPDTFHDFKDLLTSVSTRSEVLTHDNKQIGEFRYDANTQQIFGSFVLANGGFMLQDSDGKLLDEIIYPSQLNTLKYKFITHAKVSMYGLDIDVSNIEIKALYRAGSGQPRINRTATIDMQMASVPEIEVHGAFLYFIPYWLIDLLIPGTLETLIADAFEDAVTGNNGQGFTLGFQFKETNNSHQIGINTSIEMPHKLLQAILKVEDPEDRDEPRFYQTFRRNLREDFAATVAPYKDPRLDEYLSEFLQPL